MIFPEFSRSHPESLGPSRFFLKGLLRRFKYKNKQKVFVISMGKTGTSSLGKAMSRLGYRVTGKFQISSKNKKVNYDILYKKAKSLIPSYDAFQDTPWFLFYKDIEKEYPDAKFILIERNSKSWYKSIAKHKRGIIDKKQKPLRHSLHELIYGVANVNEDQNKVIESYEKHIKEVKEYFKHKSDKILITDIKNLSYFNICNFLNIKSVPREEFPYVNKASDRLLMSWKAKTYLKMKIKNIVKGKQNNI